MQQPMQFPGGKLTVAEAPATPDTSAQQSSCTSPEVATLQPQPRRAAGQGRLGASNSPLCESIWPAGDVAPEELKGIWGDTKQAATAASSVSTSAGLTPGPSEGRPDSVQDPASVLGVGRVRGPTPGRLFQQQQQPLAAPQQGAGQRGAPATPSPAKEKEVPSQSRKIFVGGVPQDMSQEDLFQVFHNYWVKKAWLQQCRTDVDELRNPSASRRNHRGFGFVIFYDANAMDELLGHAESRFIEIEEGKFAGKKIEVKRAVSSNEILTGGKASDDNSHAQPRGHPGGQTAPGPQRGAGGRQAHQAQPAQAQPMQAPPSPWPTMTTPVDQQAVPSAFLARPQQPCAMYQMMPQQMPQQMPQATHMPHMSQVPQWSLPQQMQPMLQMSQMPQMAQMPQMHQPHMGPCGGVHGCSAQGMPACGHPHMGFQQPMGFLQQPSGLPHNQHHMPQQQHPHVMTSAFAATSVPGAAP